MRPAGKLRLAHWAARAALIAVAAVPARAYIIESSAWTEGTTAAPHQVTLQLELGTTGPANRTLIDGDTTWDQVAADALTDWNQYLPTMQFNSVRGSTAAVSSTSNGVNTVSWSTTVFGDAWSQGVVGLTFRHWQITGALIEPTQESDVLFNSNSSWDSYRGALHSALDLRRVALHEFGHVLGLDHPNDYGQNVVAIMNSTISNLDDLAADDKAGVGYLYDVTPLITTQPTSQTAPPGSTVTFTVATTNDPAATFQWQFNNAAISGATQSTLTVTSVAASNQGSYRAIVTDRAASVTSSTAALVVAAGPAITANPASQILATGGSLTLSVAAAGSGLTYQWYLNGTAIAGATSSTYSVAVAGATDAGSYSVVVSNGAVGSTSAAATVAVTTTARLINLSTLADTGTAGLTAGFVIGGTGTKNLLLRGIGPALAAFNVPSALSNPVLTLNATGGSAAAVSDAGWGGSSVLANAFAAVGAFALPAASTDSALLATLAGAQTATVLGASGVEGTALLEVYDRDALAATARLVNLSVNDFITAPSTLTAGFTVAGSSSLTLLIRGIGPTLAAFGVPTVLAQPKLQVYSGTSIVATNTGWDGTAQSSAVFAQVGAFALTPGSADSAAIVTLPPGSYSAVVSGMNNTSGNALVEIYEVR